MDYGPYISLTPPPSSPPLQLITSKSKVLPFFLFNWSFSLADQLARHSSSRGKYVFYFNVTVDLCAENKSATNLKRENILDSFHIPVNLLRGGHVTLMTRFLHLTLLHRVLTEAAAELGTGTGPLCNVACSFVVVLTRKPPTAVFYTRVHLLPIMEPFGKKESHKQQ